MTASQCRKLLIILLPLGLFLVRPARAADEFAPPQKQPSVERNVVYGRAEGVDLNLEHVRQYPKNCIGQQRLGDAPEGHVFVHGGGWEGGDKNMHPTAPLFPILLARGYVVASIDYRLAPKYKFPAQIEDAKCAVRFLRAHALKYRLDPARIGVWGESAGGHLAALLGLTGPGAGFEGDGGWTNVTSRVQAVVDFYGPVDLAAAARAGDPHIGPAVFGVTNADDPLLLRASPVAYVSSNAPPFLIVHGDRDTAVRVDQSHSLQEKLTAAGATSTLLVVTNADHGFAHATGASLPSRAEIAQVVADFFDEALRR